MTEKVPRHDAVRLPKDDERPNSEKLTCLLCQDAATSAICQHLHPGHATITYRVPAYKRKVGNLCRSDGVPPRRLVELNAAVSGQSGRLLDVPARLLKAVHDRATFRIGPSLLLYFVPNGSQANGPGL